MDHGSAQLFKVVFQINKTPEYLSKWEFFQATTLTQTPHPGKPLPSFLNPAASAPLDRALKPQLQLQQVSFLLCVRIRMFFGAEIQWEREPDPHRALHACDTLEISGGIGETGLFNQWHRTGTGLNPGALRACDIKAIPQPPHSNKFYQPHSSEMKILHLHHCNINKRIKYCVIIAWHIYPPVRNHSKLLLSFPDYQCDAVAWVYVFIFYVFRAWRSGKIPLFIPHIGDELSPVIFLSFDT